jgi:pyrroline-5-carboxylate reductase
MPAIGRLAVVGGGKMGATLARALLDQGLLAPAQVVATTRHQSTAEELATRLGIATTIDNAAAVAAADVILLCVKPQTLAEALAAMAGALRPGQLLISILASATTRHIEALLPLPLPVVRAMPNTPALVGAGMTALCPGAHAGPEHLALAESLFAAIGRTLILDEKHMDAVTALSASGTAFVYVVIESLAEGGVKVGLPRRIATELAAQTCLGAAQMVLETGEHPALLKDAVTTPAGCTIDGLLTLEEGGLRVTLIKAVVEATRRAGELIGK